MNETSLQLHQIHLFNHRCSWLFCGFIDTKRKQKNISSSLRLLMSVSPLSRFVRITKSKTRIIALESQNKRRKCDLWIWIFVTSGFPHYIIDIIEHRNYFLRKVQLSLNTIQTFDSIELMIRFVKRFSHHLHSHDHRFSENEIWNAFSEGLSYLIEQCTEWDHVKHSPYNGFCYSLQYIFKL